MIRNLNSVRSSEEKIPEGWQKVSFEGKWRVVNQIYDSISRRDAEVKNILGYKAKGEVVDGFEDILGEPLGQGYDGYFNTTATVHQLAFALSLSQSPIISRLLSTSKNISSKKIIEILRGKSVLKGLRIIDLGCSVCPMFALAARSLGAQVYTADAEDLLRKNEKYLSGHTTLDLRDKDVPEILANNTDSNMDLVTESIYGTVRGSPPALKVPKLDCILKIADSLLKNGGYLYSREFDPKLESALQKTK